MMRRTSSSHRSAGSTRRRHWRLQHSGDSSMAEINRAALFGKLNPVPYKAAEGAVTFCKLRGNPVVELVHWIFQLLNAPDSDLHRVVRHFGLDQSRLVRDCQSMLDRLPRGANAIEDFSELIPHAVKEGWMYASLLF